MGKYIQYLRKSQMDRDFEDTSIQETLNRHRTILAEFTQRQGLNVEIILEEVVSGESLATRPKMQEALELISTGEYDGIVCMDTDRLSRGNSIDSGYIMQVLKINNCKIITPAKTYDLNDESDEQFTDMKFLFSRYELKTITKRLQRGREMSVKEGKYIGSIPPYGYEKLKLKGCKGYTLKIVPDEAKVVKMIFDMYVNQDLGYNNIANTLNDLHIPAKSGKKWLATSVSSILKNEEYTGKIRYHFSRTVRNAQNGLITKTRIYDLNNCDLYDGMHEAIIDENLFAKAQEIREYRNIPHTKKQTEFRNSLAGLLRCSECGKTLRVKTSSHKGGKLAYQCASLKCPTASILCDTLDMVVLEELQKWLNKYIIITRNEDKASNIIFEESLKMIKTQLNDLQKQQDNICNLLEMGVYSVELFTKRNSIIQNQIDELIDAEIDLQEKIKKETEKDVFSQTIVPAAQKLLDNYWELSPLERNVLWKQVVEKIEYSRPQTKGPFEVHLFPKLPK